MPQYNYPRIFWSKNEAEEIADDMRASGNRAAARVGEATEI